MQTPQYYLKCSNIGRMILLQTSFPISFFDNVCENVIDRYELNFYEGSCLKYLWRLGNSGRSVKSDFEKAIRCATMAVERKNALKFFHEIADMKSKKLILEVKLGLQSNDFS